MLVAYEEAMERLRDHGEEQTERHAAERRQLEDVLRDKEALARAGELTSGIVHEVRNGLGTIVGYARLVENGLAGGGGQRAQHPRGMRDPGGGHPPVRGFREAGDAFAGRPSISREC